nr:hypothetical protein [uncultured Pseudomonas sp.]
MSQPIECISQLYHCDENLKPVPVRVITSSASLMPGYRGRFVMEKRPSGGWETVRIKLKIHIQTYSAEETTCRMTCATEYSGLLDDVFYATGDGDVYLHNDLWSGPFDFDEGADWSLVSTGVRAEYEGKQRPVFQIKNRGYDKWVKLDQQGTFTFLRLTDESSASDFMLGEVSDIVYS